MKSRVVLTAALMVATCLAAVAIPATVDSADAAVGRVTPGAAPLPGFVDMVVDKVHGQVFVSTGSSVIVLNSDGAVLHTVTGLANAGDVLLSSDSATAFVVVRGDDAIDAIDTTSFEDTRIPLGQEICPKDLAISAGLLWFGYGCLPNTGNLGAVDLVTLEVHENVMTDPWPDAPILAADDVHDPGKLFVATSDRFNGHFLSEYDVAAGARPTVTEVTTRTTEAVFYMALSPDGRALIVPQEAQEVPVYSTDDLRQVAQYDHGYPAAFAVRADGMVAMDGTPADGIVVYQPGGTQVYRTYDLFRLWGDSLEPNGLAFGNTRLFVVTRHFPHGGLSLRVITPKQKTTLTVRSNSSAYDNGAEALVSARLGATFSNRVVSLWATPVGGTSRLLKRATVEEDGSITATTKVLRNMTFTARFDGDAHTSAMSASVDIKVAAGVTNTLRHSAGRSGAYHLYHVKTDPVLTTTVAPNHAGGCVYFRAQRLVNDHWRTFGLTRCVELSADSKSGVRLVGTHVAGRRIRMRAEWRADPMNTGAVGAWQYLRFTQ